MLRLIISDLMFNLPDLTESNNCQQVMQYVIKYLFLFLYFLCLPTKVTKNFEYSIQSFDLSQTAILMQRNN